MVLTLPSASPALSGRGELDSRGRQWHSTPRDNPRSCESPRVPCFLIASAHLMFAKKKNGYSRLLLSSTSMRQFPGGGLPSVQRLAFGATRTGPHPRWRIQTLLMRGRRRP